MLARHTSLGSGIAMAVLAAGAWVVADQTSGQTYSSPGIACWNGVMILGVGLGTAFAAATIRKQHVTQQRLNARIARMSDELERLHKSIPKQTVSRFDQREAAAAQSAKGGVSGPQTIWPRKKLSL
jgi:hypothetical protein